jgi:DNA-binding CsgD family transcriptional regulator
MSMALTSPAELQTQPERRVLADEPLIALGGLGLYGHNLGTITDIEFGQAAIAVDRKQTPFSPPVFSAVVLASLGFSAKETADLLQKSYNTISQQLKDARQVTHDSGSAYGHMKSGFARYLFVNRAYAIEKPGKPLGLSPAEARVIQEMSYGESSDRSSPRLFISSSTLGTHLKRVSRRNNFNNRQRVIFAAFASGEIHL